MYLLAYLGEYFLTPDIFINASSCVNKYVAQNVLIN